MNEYVAFSAMDFPQIKKIVSDADSHGVRHSRKLEAMARMLSFRSLNALHASMTSRTETYPIDVDTGIRFLLGVDADFETNQLDKEAPEVQASFGIYRVLRDNYFGRDPRPESMAYLTDELRRIWSVAESERNCLKGRDSGANGHLSDHPNNRPEFYVRCLLRRLDPNVDENRSRVMEIMYRGTHFDRSKKKEVVDTARMRGALDAVESLAAEMDILIIPMELDVAPSFAAELRDRSYGDIEIGWHQYGAVAKAFGSESTKTLQRINRGPNV